MDNQKGATNLSYIPVCGEKLKNSIMAVGLNIDALERNLKEKYGYEGTLNPYIYRNVAMPQDLFFNVIKELEILPEDIALEDHKFYGRSWKEKKEMVLTWQALKQKLRRSEITYLEYVDAISKMAPYLIPKAGQSEEDYTPEQWNKHRRSRIEELQQGVEPANIADQILQIGMEEQDGSL